MLGRKRVSDPAFEFRSPSNELSLPYPALKRCLVIPTFLQGPTQQCYQGTSSKDSEPPRVYQRSANGGACFIPSNELTPSSFPQMTDVLLNIYVYLFLSCGRRNPFPL